MKKVFFTLLAASLFAVSCQNLQQSEAASEPATNLADTPAYNGKIVYIQLDSLQAKYGMFIDLNASFQKKQAQAQSELESRSRKFQNEVNSFQQKVQNGQVTEYQARTMQEDLQKKEAELQKYSQKVSNDLAQEQIVISNQLSQELNDFIREYNSVHNYSMIIQTAAGSPVVIADPSLDITSDVITELNRRYDAKLAEEKKK